MSKKPSHIPLFPDAYLRDTTHLTTEEHGAYFLLLMAAWGNDDCTLPYDEKRLAALAKMPLLKWRKIAHIILEFWTIDNGRISQSRLLREFAYVQDKSKKAREAVQERWGRERKKEYGRNTDAIHLGGGGGGGGGSLFHPESNSLEGDGPFRIIDGGK